MKITYDKYEIVITCGVPADYYRIAKYGGYKYGATGRIFKIPTTLTVLKKLRADNIIEGYGDWIPTAWEGEYTQKDDPYYLQVVWELELSNMLTANQFSDSEDPDLRPYQYQGTKWLDYTLGKYGAAGLFWDPRVGKTRTTAKSTNNYNKIIVMSLAGQEDNWTSNYTDYSDHSVIVSLHKKSKAKRKLIYKQFQENNRIVLVGSINTLSNDALDQEMGFHLTRTNIDLLVVDEIHKIKNRKTALASGAKIIRNLSANVIGLTGTPVSKTAADVLPIIAFLFKEFKVTFIKEYFFELEASHFSSYGTATVVKKSKESEWIEFLSLMFSSIKKEDVLVWASEPDISTIYREMEGKQWKAYQSCQLDFQVPKLIEDEIETEEIQEVIAQITRLRQISTSLELLDPTMVGESTKEKWIMEFLSNKDNYNGLIIFSWHTRYLKILKEKLEAKGHKVGIISGETKNKIVMQDAFQNGEFDIVLCNIQAGSKGITLDRADTMIFLDRDWKPDENKQAAERFTATSPEREQLKKIYYLQTSNQIKLKMEVIETIDKYMQLVLDQKIQQTEIVTMFRELLLNKERK